MKKLIIITAVLFGMGFAAGVVRADDITVSGINIKDLVSKTRVGIWLPIGGGATFKTIYSPIISLHDIGGIEYAVIDVGAAAPGNITHGFAFAAIGLRIDTLLDRALGVSAWIKSHISAVELPTLEVGAGPVLVGNKIKYGGSIALKF